MSPSKRFKPVQRVVASRERDAARALGQSQKTRQEAEAKLQELQQYHLEYQKRFQAQAAQGMTASQMQEYQAFLHKLDKAVEEQRRVVQASSRDVDNKQGQWREKHMRTKVVGNVVDRLKEEERRTAEQREQKAQDDRSQRRR